MGIETVDTNFVLQKEEQTGMEYYAVPSAGFSLYGVNYDEKDGFWRMPIEIAKKVSDGVSVLTYQTSGGRLRFSTDSKRLEIRVRYDVLWPMPHMTLVGQGGFILLEEGEKGRKLVKILPPDFSSAKGYTASTDLKGDGMRDYILYFPLYNEVKGLEIGLDKGAKVGKGKAYRDIKPILYYGSSITQGGCASRPDNSYQAFIEKWNNIDFINLGFSGNAKGEDEMVDYLTTIDCSLFVCDYDHNAPTAEHLEKTHYRLYERYRKVRPTTPILFLTKPDLWGEDELLRENIIRKTYKKARSLGDENVYFIAGRTFYGALERDNCAVDGCHPNDLGFSRMAQKIYKKMIEIDKKFK